MAALWVSRVPTGEERGWTAPERTGVNNTTGETTERAVCAVRIGSRTL